MTTETLTRSEHKTVQLNSFTKHHQLLHTSQNNATKHPSDKQIHATHKCFIKTSSMK